MKLWTSYDEQCTVCIVVVERILTVPSSVEIAKIDNESFRQQKFKSVAGSSTGKVIIAIACNAVTYCAWYINK